MCEKRKETSASQCDLTDCCYIVLIEERHHSRSHSLSLILWDVDELWQPDVCVCVLCTHARVTEQSLNVAFNLSLALCVSLLPVLQSVYFSSANQFFFPFRWVLSFSPPSLPSLRFHFYLHSSNRWGAHWWSAKTHLMRNCKGIFLAFECWRWSCRLEAKDEDHRGGS